MPKVLEDLMLNYYDLYPNTMDEFFNISEEELEQLIKIYLEEFVCAKKAYTKESC